eukprot:3280080-Pyramimonas_sp.AAC.1
MSSAEPTDYETSTEHLAGILNIQANDWLSAEAAAQPLSFAEHVAAGRITRKRRRPLSPRAYS